MIPQRGYAVEELLAIGRSESWNESPGWDESLRYQLSQLKKKRKLGIVGLAIGMLLTSMNLFTAIIIFANRTNSPTVFDLLITPLLIFAIFWGWQTAKLFSVVSKAGELSTQLLRVGINFDVYMYQMQKARYDPPPYSC